MNEVQKKYDRLDETSKRLLLVLALQHGEANCFQFTNQAKQFALRQSNGRELTQTFVRDSLKKWTNSGLLRRSPARPAPELMDTLVRDGLSGADAQRLLAFAQSRDRWGSRDALLDFYVAFYSHDANAWKAARRQIADGSLPLLAPFCQKTFEQLPPELQHGFFTFVIPSWIAQAELDPEAPLALRRLLDADADLPTELLPRLLDWAVASGDRALLERIGVQTGAKMQDVEG